MDMDRTGILIDTLRSIPDGSCMTEIMIRMLYLENQEKIDLLSDSKCFDGSISCNDCSACLLDYLAAVYDVAELNVKKFLNGEDQ